MPGAPCGPGSRELSPPCGGLGHTASIPRASYRGFAAHVLRGFAPRARKGVVSRGSVALLPAPAALILALATPILAGRQGCKCNPT